LLRNWPLFADHLDFQAYGHLIADHHAAGFQGLVPDETEVFPVDPGGCRSSAAAGVNLQGAMSLF